MVHEDDEAILEDITRLDELYQEQVWIDAEVKLYCANCQNLSPHVTIIVI
jgi:hypothetical protein